MLGVVLYCGMEYLLYADCSPCDQSNPQRGEVIKLIKKYMKLSILGTWAKKMLII